MYTHMCVIQNDKIILVKRKFQTKTKTKLQEVMKPNIMFSETTKLVLDEKASQCEYNWWRTV